MRKKLSSLECCRIMGQGEEGRREGERERE